MTDEFAAQCKELGHRLTEVLVDYPKPVAICALPAVMAAVSKTLGVPRDTFVEMLDSALEDMEA